MSAVAAALFADADSPVEEIELDLLLEGLFRRYGVDFRDYARASLRRRVRHCLAEEGLATVSALQDRVLREPAAFRRFVAQLSVHSTAMFRDPGFYRAFADKVVPALARLPFIRVWHAGCSTGEEVYSLAILLREAGLLDRTRIYATDMNEAVLTQAKAGIYPLRRMQAYAAPYQQAGGRRSLADHYTARYDHALLDASLRAGIVWAAHNLAGDASFNEFHAILCRNVMIYFGPTLRRRVHALLHESLATGGFLALGRQEALDGSGHERRYLVVDEAAKLYRKPAG